MKPPASPSSSGDQPPSGNQPSPRPSRRCPQAAAAARAAQSASPAQLDRRALLIGGGLAAAGLAAYTGWKQWTLPISEVFIARNQRYDSGLEQTIRDGLLAVGLDAARLDGRRVLLKPNLVEPNRDVPHMTTHPALIVAVAEVFRRFGARVTVGEGPGHVRDIDMALSESGVGAALEAAELEFVDLNHDEVGLARNRGRVSDLKQFFFPRAVLEADLVVSLPKLKTHHWVGMTCAMKNLYGLLPGIKYGWPKNVLHHHGIPETVVDINASAPPTIAIVDAIECMEGDGPIMGSPKPLGLVVVGTNAAAVDATCARIMGLEPSRISYLALAADRLGPLSNRRIYQRGEAWQSLVSPFSILDYPHLQYLRHDRRGELVS